MSDEHSFQRFFKEELEKWNGHCPSLVASMFMAGMPDLIINTSKGYTYYTELKFWRNKNPPSNSQQIQALLRGPQIAVIKHTLWKRSIACPIIAQLQYDMDTCAVAYKDKFLLANVKTMAKIMALLSSKEQFDTLFT
jgi:hypothetical protein